MVRVILAQNHKGPHAGVMTQKDAFTRHGHARKVAALVAQSFGNEKKAGLLAERQIASQIGCPDEGRLGPKVTLGVVISPWIEGRIAVIALQGFYETVNG